MQQIPGVNWLLGLLFGSILVLIVLNVLSALKLVQLRKRVLSLAGWVVTFEVVFLLGFLFLSQSSRREDLVRVVASQVTQLEVSHAQRKSSVSTQPEVSRLLSLMQSLKPVMAHHSHPTETWDVAFTCQGRQYRYRLAQDSKRPEEFWVLRITPADVDASGFEIGRVQSSQLLPFLNQLLEEKR